jgi:uncharacterized membrane protein YfcA
VGALPRPARRWPGLNAAAGTGRGREVAIALVAGSLVSLAAGLFGVGGGTLLVPVLVLILHRAQHVAHATSLVAILFAAVSGGVRFALDDAVSWDTVAIVAVAAIGGAQLGARFLPRMTDSGLKRLFGVVLLLVGVRFLLAGSGTAATATSVPDLELATALGYLALGLAAGISSAVLGVGGGVILVPVLVVVFGFGQHIAEGTSLAIIVPTALSGAIAHHRSGYTDWSLGGVLGVAGVVGGALGAQVALGLDPDTLARGFGGLMVLVSGLMLWPARSGG